MNHFDSIDVLGNSPMHRAIRMR